MTKYGLRRFGAAILATALLLTAPAAAVAPPVGPVTVRVGLAYEGGALPVANLDNNVGSGYRFGYFDEALNFTQLGSTSVGQISVMQARDVYSYGSVYPGGGSSAITVVETGTNQVLFQFAGQNGCSFGIKPGQDDSVKTATWFKGFRYYGSFRYDCQSDGNVAVINILPLEDYLKGVVSAEMSTGWPMEALKAQAVASRSYAMICMNKHKSSGFDVCNTTDCQAYTGLNKAGADTDQAVDETAGVYARYQGEVAQTYYYSSDGGATEDVKNVWGSSIPYLMGVRDPWEASVAATVPNYSWTVTVTAADLQAKLRAKGYDCADIMDFYVSERSVTGNVTAFTFVDILGKKYTISNKSGEQCRIMLGLRSINYSIYGGSGEQVGVPGTPTPTAPVVSGGSYFVNGTTDTLPSVAGTYAVDGNGNVSAIGSAPYIITGSGMVEVLPDPADTSTGIGGGIPGAPSWNTGAVGSTGGGSGVYTISGSGYGHLVGMSQWGANAMAKQGKTYVEILKFYFTGVDVW